MFHQTATCLACGFEGGDKAVRKKVVRYETQPTFRAEWRCTDVKACEQRQAELAAAEPRGVA